MAILYDYSKLRGLIKEHFGTQAALLKKAIRYRYDEITFEDGQAI